MKDLDILAESAISSLSLCGSDALGKLFRAENRFADQLILSTPSVALGRAHSGFAPNPISCWGSLLSRLVEQCRFGKTQPIRLSGDAVEMLAAVRNRKVALIASKVAMQFNGCSLPPEPEIPTRVMQAAIAIATTLIERSDEIVKDVLTRQSDAEICRDAEKNPRPRSH